MFDCFFLNFHKIESNFNFLFFLHSEKFSSTLLPSPHQKLPRHGCASCSFIFASKGDFKVKYKYFVKETVMSVSGNVQIHR